MNAGGVPDGCGPVPEASGSPDRLLPGPAGFRGPSGVCCPAAEIVSSLRSGQRTGPLGGVRAWEDWDVRRARQRPAAAAGGRGDHSPAGCVARRRCATEVAGRAVTHSPPRAAAPRVCAEPLMDLSGTCRRPAVDLALLGCCGREVKYRRQQRFHVPVAGCAVQSCRVSRIRGGRPGTAHSGPVG